MKSTWTLNEDSTGVLKVEVDKETWTKAQDKALDELTKEVEVEGFRKGNAPKKLAAKQVGGERILSEAVNMVANDAFTFGIVENKIEPVARPTLDVEAISEDGATLLFNIVVKPDVKLGDYKGLKVEDEAVIVTDEEVAEQLEKIRQENAELHLKEDAIVNGDTAVIDFEGFKDGVAFEGGKGENYSLEIGSNSFIPGFEEALIGLKAGEEKDIDVTFPESYQVEDLAGKPVVFKVKVHEVKEKVIPELTDEFIEDLGDETVTTVDELKKTLLENMETTRKQAEEDRVSEALILAATENAEIDLPHVMIHEELDQMFQEFNQRLAQQGMNFELYSQILGQSEEEIKSQMHDDAEKRVRTRLVLEAIAEAEELEASEEEIDKEFTTLSEMYNMEVDQIKDLISADQLKYDVLLRKAIDVIKENRA